MVLPVTVASANIHFVSHWIVFLHGHLSATAPIHADGWTARVFPQGDHARLLIGLYHRVAVLSKLLLQNQAPGWNGVIGIG